MLDNYFRIAWRTLTRHKTYTLINILGLTLGICSCLVIWLIAKYEFSFDRFHTDKDRIYRIVTSEQLTDNSPVRLLPAVIPPVADALREAIPGIETIAPYHILFDAKVNAPVNSANPFNFPSTPIVAGPEYFAIMKYDWLAGDERKALSEPFKVVLTEQKARLYFGSAPLDQLIGSELIYDDSLHVTVAGIIKDWKENSDFAYTEFISLPTAQHGYLQHSLQLDQTHWKGVPYSSRILLRLDKKANPADVGTAISSLFDQRWRQKGKAVALQPITRVHFTETGAEKEVRTAHLPTLYALMSIAVFILVLAIINYVNLATAQSLSRDKEIGIRKVLGSSRASLIAQFLLETSLLVLVAVGLACLLVTPVLTAFRSFIPLGVRFTLRSPSTLLFLAAIILSTTLLAGFYPARFLSSYLPALTLRGSGAAKGSEKWWLRKGLVVFQFTISLTFIIVTLVIGRQIHFMLSKDLGFRSEAIVLLDTNDSRDSISRVKGVADAIRQLPGVAGVARENMPPMGLDRGIFGIQYKERSDEQIPVAAIKADEHFIPTYVMRLLSGRNLLPSDTIREVIINESLSKMLGFKTPEKAIGHSIYTWNKYCPIVGVVADFHQASFHEAIKPMLIAGMACTDLAIRIDTKSKTMAEMKVVLARIEQQWKKFYPHTPFEYSFLDDSLAQLYKKEQTSSWLMNIATGITIFISCIGLFGLTMFTAEKKTREIGIRKILGASVANIVTLLIKDFVALIILALLVASPIAGLFMHKWLQDYAYRIPLAIDIYLIAGAAILFITLLTIGYQSLKAALANPVQSLRAE